MKFFIFEIFFSLVFFSPVFVLFLFFVLVVLSVVGCFLLLFVLFVVCWLVVFLCLCFCWLFVEQSIFIEDWRDEIRTLTNQVALADGGWLPKNHPFPTPRPRIDDLPHHSRTTYLLQPQAFRVTTSCAVYFPCFSPLRLPPPLPPPHLCSPSTPFTCHTVRSRLLQNQPNTPPQTILNNNNGDDNRHRVCTRHPTRHH